MQPKDKARILVGGALVLTVIYFLKSHYSGASALELRWILEPTSYLVSNAVGAEFTFEAGTGWFSQAEMFAIAPACAGVNFLMAAFLTLASVSLWRLPNAASAMAAVVLSLAIAYVATLLVNTLRIAISLRASDVGSSLFSGSALHRAQGIVIFFTALVLVYVAAERLLPELPTAARKCPNEA